MDGNDYICGDDGCGGICGSCGIGEKCVMDCFWCIVDCSDEINNFVGIVCDDENVKIFNDVCVVNVNNEIGCFGTSCLCVGL